SRRAGPNRPAPPRCAAEECTDLEQGSRRPCGPRALDLSRTAAPAARAGRAARLPRLGRPHPARPAHAGDHRHPAARARQERDRHTRIARRLPRQRQRRLPDPLRRPGHRPPPGARARPDRAARGRPRRDSARVRPRPQARRRAARRVKPAADFSVAAYLDALGAGTPAPASGSGAALCGAIGAALAELAARVTGDVAAADELVGLRARLVALADEDAEAYTAFMRTRADAERERTIDVPLAIAEAARRVVASARRLVESGKPSVRGDAEAGTELAAAAARVGARLVELNLKGGDDPRL